MKARKTEEQFDSDTAQMLRNLQRRLEAIRTTGKASDYFLFEAAGCLDRGLILGALQLATAALELRAREILVQYAIAIIPEYDGPSNDVESAFEADRGYFFYNIVAVLRGAGVIDIDDQIELIDVYKKIRIPLHHGIVGRYAGRSEYDETIDLLGN